MTKSKIQKDQNQLCHRFILQPLPHSFDRFTDSLPRRKNKNLDETNAGIDITCMSPSTSFTAEEEFDHSVSKTSSSNMCIGRMELIQSTVKFCKEDSSKDEVLKVSTKLETNNNNDNAILENGCSHCKFWCYVGAKYLSKQMISFKVQCKHCNAATTTADMDTNRLVEQSSQLDDEPLLLMHVHSKFAKIIHINGRQLSLSSSLKSKHDHVITSKLTHGDLLSISISLPTKDTIFHHHHPHHHMTFAILSLQNNFHNHVVNDNAICAGGVTSTMHSSTYHSNCSSDNLKRYNHDCTISSAHNLNNKQSSFTTHPDEKLDKSNTNYYQNHIINNTNDSKPTMIGDDGNDDKCVGTSSATTTATITTTSNEVITNTKSIINQPMNRLKSQLRFITALKKKRKLNNYDGHNYLQKYNRNCTISNNNLTYNNEKDDNDQNENGSNSNDSSNIKLLEKMSTINNYHCSAADIASNTKKITKDNNNLSSSFQESQTEESPILDMFHFSMVDNTNASFDHDDHCHLFQNEEEGGNMEVERDDVMNSSALLISSLSLTDLKDIRNHIEYSKDTTGSEIPNFENVDDSGIHDSSSSKNNAISSKIQLKHTLLTLCILSKERNFKLPQLLEKTRILNGDMNHVLRKKYK